MAIFIHGMGILLFTVLTGASNMDLRSDATSFMQNRISQNELSEAQSSIIKPVDILGVMEINALGEMLYGVPYEKMFVDIFKDRLDNHTKRMSLFGTSGGMAKSLGDHLAHLHDNFQQYKEAVVISNVFIHFDKNGDNKINRTELDSILAYLGEKWHDAMTNKLMHDLDRMSVDNVLQPTEFFFWFTWPALDKPMSFDKKIADLKTEAARLKKKGKSTQMQATEEIDTDTIVLESSDVPKDPAEVKKVFGRFTQFQDALRILFFFKTFDSDWDGRVSKQEMTTMIGFLEPGAWSPHEIDSLMAALDTQTVDKTIGINEWFFWFTPTFAKVWEPAIRPKAKGKMKSQAGIPQLSS